MNINALKAVIKKELNSYFNHPLAYILLCLFVGVSYFFFFKGLFIIKEATIRPYFEVLIWFLLFLVPAVTMRSIAGERKDGTLEVMLAQPITEFELLLGKFLADYIFIFIAILISLTLPITLMLGGKLDFGMVAAQYIGSFFLIGAVVSMGMWASSLTKNQTVALLGGIFSIFTLTIIGLDVIVLGVPFPINNIFQELSLLTHFENITRGVIDLRDVVYFISVMVVFYALTYLSFMNRKLNKQSKNFKNLQIGIAIIAVITIVINLFGYYVNYRIDFTADKIYSLSEGTSKVLKELNDKITVKFYSSQELPPQVAGTYRDVRDALEDYVSASGGKMEVIYKPLGSSEKDKQEAQAAGIQPVQFNIQEDEGYQVKEGYMGMVLSYNDKQEVIPFVQRTDDFEYQLTSLIRKMSNKKMEKIVFTSGHGEKEISQGFGNTANNPMTISGFGQTLSKSYSVEPLDKKKLTASSLKDVSVLIIAGPKQAFSKKELAAIKEYIDNGGKVMALIDNVDINPQYGFAQPVEKSFGDFLKTYGISVNKDLVYDLQAKTTRATGYQEGVGVVVEEDPFLMSVQPYSNDNVITTGIKAVTLPWASSVDFQAGKGKFTTLLSTTSYAGAQTSNFDIRPSNNKSISNQGLRQYKLAVSAQGLPNDGRLVVVGDSDFLIDPIIENNQRNLIFGLNIVDWLIKDEILIGIRSKSAQSPKLIFKSDSIRNFVRYFNNAGIVLFIALFGFYRLSSRRKKTTEAYS